jgi:hypothetical protein
MIRQDINPSDCAESIAKSLRALSREQAQAPASKTKLHGTRSQFKEDCRFQIDHKAAQAAEWSRIGTPKIRKCSAKLLVRMEASFITLRIPTRVWLPYRRMRNRDRKFLACEELADDDSEFLLNPEFLINHSLFNKGAFL